jgi:hypothetical protein
MRGNWAAAFRQRIFVSVFETDTASSQKSLVNRSPLAWSAAM